MFFASRRNPKFAKHTHMPLTHLGGTSRCFARPKCRAEHVNVPPMPLQRGWRCFAIFGLGMVVSSGGPCAAVWRNGAVANPEINEPIRITSYKGNVRIDEIHPKWELVGTHTGRRSFVVNALSLGIPPNIVMKWTGHSDYKAMKPYIDIVDSIKADSLEVVEKLTVKYEYFR